MCENLNPDRIRCEACRTINLAKHINHPKPDMQMYNKCGPTQKICSPVTDNVIETHFWMKRNEIMQTVANWITELEGQTGDDRTQRSIQLNLMALKRHYVKLQEKLTKLPVPAGLEELDEPFRLPAAPPTPSRPHI